MLVASLGICMGLLSSCQVSGHVESGGASRGAAIYAAGPSRVAAVGHPSVTFRRDGDGRVLADVSMSFTSKAVEPLSVANYLTLSLLDESNEPIKTAPLKKVMHFTTGGSYDLSESFSLSNVEFQRLRSVRVVSVCMGEGASAGRTKDARAVSEGKRRFRNEEVARAEREHEEAWRARFPVDDYSNTVLIGDSLMQNATSSLQAMLPGVSINADAGRTLEMGGLVFEDESSNAGVLDHVRNDDGSFERYVIGTGNNDIGGMPLEAAEEIVNRLGPDKEIYFITEIVVGNSYGTSVTNASIDQVVEEYPNVHKIDWYGLVAGHESEYLSDGTHARRDREPDYAACIKAGLDVVY